MEQQPIPIKKRDKDVLAALCKYTDQASQASYLMTSQSEIRTRYKFLSHTSNTSTPLELLLVGQANGWVDILEERGIDADRAKYIWNGITKTHPEYFEGLETLYEQKILTGSFIGNESMAKNITWDRDSKIRDFLDVDNAIHALAVYSALRTKFAPELPAIDVVSFIRERNNEVNESQWYSPEAEAVTVRALQILEGEGKVYDGKTDPVEALTLLLESGCGILTYKRSRIAGTNTFVITEPRIERGAENIETLCKNLKVDDLADIPEYLNGRFVAVIDNTISQEQEQALRKLIEQPQFAPIREKASVIFGKLSRYDRVKPFYAMADRRRGNFVRRRELR